MIDKAKLSRRISNIWTPIVYWVLGIAAGSILEKRELLAEFEPSFAHVLFYFLVPAFGVCATWYVTD